ncbi:MAG: hypothetical protein ACREPH_05770, partial [Rhodanobacteraceae bacterium]
MTSLSRWASTMGLLVNVAHFARGQQHEEDGVGDHHAGSGVVAELRVPHRADRAVESGRAGQIAYRQVDEDLLGHAG